MYSVFLQYVEKYTSYLFLTSLVLVFLLVSKIRDSFGNNIESYWTSSLLDAVALDPIRTWLLISEDNSSIHFWDPC